MAKPTKTVSADALFSPAEIGDLIANAFTASCNPAWGGVALSDKRAKYCRDYAKTLAERLSKTDIDAGHMSYVEAVSMLLGTALAIQKLYCQD